MTIDFVEIVRTAAVYTNAVNGAAKHIINEHSGDGALTVGGIGFNPLCLAGRICRFLTPGFTENAIEVT